MPKSYKIGGLALLVLVLPLCVGSSQAQVEQMAISVAPYANYGVTVELWCGVNGQSIAISSSITKADRNTVDVSAMLYLKVIGTGFEGVMYAIPYQPITLYAVRENGDTWDSATVQSDRYGFARETFEYLPAPSCFETEWELYSFYATWDSDVVSFENVVYDLPSVRSDTVYMLVCDGEDIWEGLVFRTGSYEGLAGLMSLWQNCAIKYSLHPYLQEQANEIVTLTVTLATVDPEQEPSQFLEYMRAIANLQLGFGQAVEADIPELAESYGLSDFKIETYVDAASTFRDSVLEAEATSEAIESILGLQDELTLTGYEAFLQEFLKE